MGVVADSLRNEPMTAWGQYVQAPLLTSSASVDVHTDGDSVSNTDPQTDLASEHYSFISGYVDVDRQAFDRSNLDQAIARELGELYGSKLDEQILSGSGTTGELLGLLTVTPGTNVTYTDASPTAQKVLASAIGATVAGVGEKRGMLPDLVILHATRYAWLTTKLAYDPGQGLADIGLPVRFVPTETMPLVNTNQDPIIALRREDIPLFRDRPHLRIQEDVGSGNLRVRILIWGDSAFLPSRYLKAIGVATGSGLVTPAWL
jgi:hypothetical protein